MYGVSLDALSKYFDCYKSEMSDEPKKRSRVKGRGHEADRDRDSSRKDGVFESIPQAPGKGPGKCKYLLRIFDEHFCYWFLAIEGWIIFVSNVHQEAQEDDILDCFSDFGSVKNINVNLDRRTGYVKVLLEYST